MTPVLVLAVVIMLLPLAAGALGVGTDSTSDIADWSSRAVMAGAAIAVAIRASRLHDQRTAWTLIALALAAWTAGDLCFGVAGGTTHPSPSDALWFLMYGAFVAGLRMLRGREPVSLALVVVLLGLATLWSWLVFGEMIGGAGGNAGATATSVAYPVLDLVLVASTLLALAGRGWRIDRRFCALAGGFLLMALADSVYAVQVAGDLNADRTLVAAIWPAGALCIATAAWMAPGRVPSRKERGDRPVERLTSGAIAVGVGILVIDHFAPVDTVTAALAGLTLVTAIVQRSVVHRDRAVALEAVEAVETLRVASSEAALDCMISIDGHGRVCEWNHAAAQTFGYTREAVVGVELADLIIPAHSRVRHRSGLARLAQSGQHRVLNTQFETTAMHADGREFPVELMITQVRAEPPMFTGFLRDISDRRRREQENERLAAIVRSAEDAVISKDLGGIVTAWNDGAERLYGYTAAEAIGRPLIGLTIGPAQAYEMETMTESVTQGEWAATETWRQRKDGSMVEVSIRAFAMRDVSGQIVGMCTSAHDITDRRHREELARLDEDGHLWRTRIETALSEGLFMFWGQPVVDVTSGAIHHHELLLRMDLDGSVITPNHFLPHAESCALITEIDRFAVKSGFEIAKTTPVAINLSARSLEDPRLIADIKEALSGERLAANVIFEITETAAVQNLDAARELVQELTALGFGVALDDFGTGYGSFTYLKHLPVTELKIDIDFVRGLAQDPTDQRLVKSIVSVAQNFDMKTVAEGVEDQETLDLLRTLGVDFVQGYHIGYPAQMTGSERWPTLAKTDQA